uniref:Uncharacterized protein n=1 Tax=Bubo bubo TaxID=30461 RepID=A0A8C0ECG4_BUBBB
MKLRKRLENWRKKVIFIFMVVLYCVLVLYCILLAAVGLRVPSRCRCPFPLHLQVLT